MGADEPSIIWSSYNKTIQLAKNAITDDFLYGPDRRRFQKQRNTETTHYVGSRFERRFGGNAQVMRSVIYANGRAVMIREDQNNGSPHRYLHRAHLGSVTAITDESTGNVLDRLGFDAWGMRRVGTSWAAGAVTATDVRGYTSHEHLDDIGVIHMNGRSYSPSLGRMLSPDPVTQSPDNGQNYSRHTYAFNNPLRFTCLSGYQVETLVGPFGDLPSELGSGENGSPPPFYGLLFGRGYNDNFVAGYDSLDQYLDYIFDRDLEYTDALEDAQDCMDLPQYCVGRTPYAGDVTTKSGDPVQGTRTNSPRYDAAVNVAQETVGLVVPEIIDELAGERFSSPLVASLIGVVTNKPTATIIADTIGAGVGTAASMLTSFFMGPIALGYIVSSRAEFLMTVAIAPDCSCGARCPIDQFPRRYEKPE